MITRVTLSAVLLSCITGTSLQAQEVIPSEVPGSTGSVPFGMNTLTTVRALDGNVWLQQNLGADSVGTAMDDATAFGDLYQWGRWTDGHGIRTSATANTSTLSSSDPSGLGTGSAFFYLGANPADWWGAGSAADSWQGTVASATNGIDPCTALGPLWHLPSTSDWEALMTAEEMDDRASAFGSNLKLVVTGSRDGGTGTIINAGSYGNYWSSTTSGVYAKCFAIGDTWITPSDDAYRGYGMSMRCLNEDLHTGIEAPDPMRGLAIYPNPSTGIFTMEVGNALITSITVYSADMRIVSASNPRTIRPMIALEELPNGLYSVKVTSGGNIAWRTIIVAH